MSPHTVTGVRTGWMLDSVDCQTEALRSGTAGGSYPPSDTLSQSHTGASCRPLAGTCTALPAPAIHRARRPWRGVLAPAGGRHCPWAWLLRGGERQRRADAAEGSAVGEDDAVTAARGQRRGVGVRRQRGGPRRGGAALGDGRGGHGAGSRVGEVLAVWRSGQRLTRAQEQLQAAASRAGLWAGWRTGGLAGWRPRSMQQRRCGKWRTRAASLAPANPLGRLRTARLLLTTVYARLHVASLRVATPRRPDARLSSSSRTPKAPVPALPAVQRRLPTTACCVESSEASAPRPLLPAPPSPVSAPRAPRSITPSRHRKLLPPWPLRRASTASCPSQPCRRAAPRSRPVAPKLPSPASSWSCADCLQVSPSPSSRPPLATSGSSALARSIGSATKRARYPRSEWHLHCLHTPSLNHCPVPPNPPGQQGHTSTSSSRTLSPSSATTSAPSPSKMLQNPGRIPPWSVPRPSSSLNTPRCLVAAAGTTTVRAQSIKTKTSRTFSRASPTPSVNLLPPRANRQRTPRSRRLR